MSDPRIDAIREDRLVGRGTCASIDECYEDAELIELLDDEAKTTPTDAVNHCRWMEGLWAEKETNQWSGEETEEYCASVFARINELKERV